MIKVVVLGANGGLGQQVCKLLGREKNVELISVIRDLTQQSENKVFWDYLSRLPKAAACANVVVNCARSSCYEYNIRFNKLIVNSLSEHTVLLNISSNCIFAEPRGTLSKLLFKGDAYIREKAEIEAITNEHNNTFQIRPTIVLGESGWDEFLARVKKSKKVFVPKVSSGAKVKVIYANEVAEFVCSLIKSGFKSTVEEELYTSILPLEVLLNSTVEYSATTNNYFNSLLNNLFMFFLVSRFIPNWVVYKVQSKIISSNISKVNTTVDNLDIQGMTRLYLSGAHTK